MYESSWNNNSCNVTKIYKLTTVAIIDMDKVYTSIMNASRTGSISEVHYRGYTLRN